MKEANLVFPHQLFEDSPLPDNGLPFYLVEEHLFFQQFAFHKQKMAYHRAGMKFYQQYLESKNTEVFYIDAGDKRSDIRRLLTELGKKGVKTLNYIDPVDDWLEKRIEKASRENGIKTDWHSSPLFLNSKKDLEGFFNPEKKKFFQATFYKDQRIKHDILLEDGKKPVGGKWSFDSENRKRYPSGKTPPALQHPRADKVYREAVEYVKKYFADNPGELMQEPLYPYTYRQAREWLKDFLEQRFEGFGPYEDAIVKDETFLHHSVLTPMLNNGLLTPKEILKEALSYAREHEVQINSTEGFVRQIIGWREFIRGMYVFRGGRQRTTNFWDFKRKIPPSFYDGSTGIEPLDHTIKKVLKNAYCHHIERLMILGNFMLLCEFDPDEVYRWFMELFIDAYDWVMVPNVYGMSQFADGGLMSTKPYLSGSNYLVKMGNYTKGDWQKTWDALFWRFMHVHRGFFLKNPRMGMLIRSFDKMSETKQNNYLDTAEDFLKSLDNEIQ